MKDELLDAIRKMVFNAMGQGATAEDVAYAMATGVEQYLNKIAELDDRLPSFSARQIPQSAIVTDGSYRYPLPPAI